MSAPIFISYPSQNEKSAKAVCKFLEDRGIDCWIAPRNIGVGTEYAEALVDAINDCQALVLVFSSHANTSNQVKREVERAVSKGKVIVPIKIEDVPPTKAMEFFICNTHWLDSCDPPSEAHLENLFRDIRSFLSALGKMTPSHKLPKVPSQIDRASLADRQTTGSSDSNMGSRPLPTNRQHKVSQLINLDHLDNDALNVVQFAQSLASRSRSTEITHRLFMAGFLSESEGFASRVCRAAGVNPRLLCALLVALSHQDSDSEDDDWPTLQLTVEATERILLPTLDRASRMAANRSAISERELFHAFCEQADPAFIEFLKYPVEDEAVEPVEVDLTELRQMNPDQPGMLKRLTLRARIVVKQAHQLARQRRVSPIPNRLVLAAFISTPERLACRLLREAHVAVTALCEALVNSASGTTEVDPMLNAELCERIITPMLRRSRELAGQGCFVTERILLRAFSEVTDPRFKAQLKTIGIDLDLLGAQDSNTALKPKAEPTLPPADPEKVNWN